MTTTLCLDPQPGPGNSVIPKTENAATLRLFSHECWAEIHRLFETYLGGSPLVAPSSYKDLLNDDLRPLIEKYYRGSDSSAEQRINYQNAGKKKLAPSGSSRPATSTGQ